MLNPKHLDDFTRQISDAMPASFKQVQDDLDRNLKAALQSALNKMDLVTREEFDVQSAVLGRTRAKLEDLEKRVAELEDLLKSQGKL